MFCIYHNVIKGDYSAHYITFYVYNGIAMEHLYEVH